MNTPKTATKTLKVADLHFDHANPRLVEFGITETTPEDEVLVTLWDAMDVRELVLSMAASGYFPHEPLIVTDEDGKYIVIEGNRRLAALKVLADPAVAKEHRWDVPEISPEARKQLKSVPAIFQEREESWRYLGFKHVNGPAKWTSFAKAKYIADVHRKYGISLEGIASQIGDGHNTVRRLYRALMILEQAERENVYDPENRFTPRIYFSHLYTGMDFSGFSTFLQLAPKEDETKDPVSKEKLKELGEVCVWLFGDKKAKQPPVVKTQNPDLRQLNAVLENREAVAALRDGEDLSKAFEISRPSGAVLEEALLKAKRELMRASGYVATGYDKSESLLKIAGSVATIADSIYEKMEQMRSGNTKPKRLTDL